MALKQLEVLKIGQFLFGSSLTLLEKHRANSQVECSIEMPDCGNLLKFTGHDLL